MRIFSKLYFKILNWAEHKKAVYYLAFLSFIESSLLPYPPPDVMLAPMVLKKMENAFSLAFITTIFSVTGGVFGYVLGMIGYELLLPFFEKMNYIDKLANVKLWFDEYGVWVVFIAGFSPIPYKLFTIMAGVLSMALLPFVLASIVARGARFFLVAYFVYHFGEKCDEWLRKYIDGIGWLVVVIAIGLYLYVR